MPQRISFNQDAIVPTSLAPSTFYNNLPNVTTAFEATYLPNQTYYGYYNAVYE